MKLGHRFPRPLGGVPALQPWTPWGGDGGEGRTRRRKMGERLCYLVLNSGLEAAHGLLVCARLVPGPEVPRGVRGGN